MTTVAAIAAKAFTAVSAKITDAVHAATLSDGATTYTGRAVFGKEVPSAEFPKFTPSASAQVVTLEGFTTAPADSWTLTVGGVAYFILRVADIAKAGTLFNVQAIKSADLLFASVSLQAKTKTPDGMGGNTLAWDSPTAIPCYLEGISGAERWAAMRVSPNDRYRCIISYDATITAEHRAVINSKTYAIESVMDMGGRGVWSELILVDGAAP